MWNMQVLQADLASVKEVTLERLRSLVSALPPSQKDEQKLATPPGQESLPTVGKQETILDKLGDDGEKKLEKIVTNQKTTKSGKNGRQPVEVVEQESELTKVKYHIDSKNRRAVFVTGLGIIDDYMASEDLNECVDALLLKRSKAAFE